MGKLSKYIRIHRRPYSIRVKSGEGKLAIDFYDGYVVIRNLQPGCRAAEIPIPRSAWLALLRALPKPTRLMEGPDFDRNQAEREYLATLALLEKQSKRSKKAAQEARHEEQKRARYLRAKARARRRASSTH